MTDQITLANDQPDYIRNLNTIATQSIIEKYNLPSMINNIMTSRAIIYKNPTSNLLMMIPNRGSPTNSTQSPTNTIYSIDWVIQMTIGVLIEDVVDVLNYLGYVDDEKKIIDLKWKNAVTNGINLIREFINLMEYVDTKVILHNYNENDIKILLNVVTIIIYETSLMKNYEKDKRQYTFGIRHTYSQIVQIIPPRIKNDFKFYCSNLGEDMKKYELKNLSNIKMEDFYDNTELFYDLMTSLLTNNVSEVKRRDQYGNVEKLINGSDMKQPISNPIDTKYNIHDNIILIEMRSFYKHINKKIGAGIQHKVTLEELQKKL
jgi:hypothetical protein